MNGDEKLVLSAGGSATVKRGTAHAWCNLGEKPVQMLMIFSPGHMEKTFRLIGSLKDGDLAAFAELADGGGSTIVGSPPFDNVYSVISPRPKH